MYNHAYIQLNLTDHHERYLPRQLQSNPHIFGGFGAFSLAYDRLERPN